MSKTWPGQADMVGVFNALVTAVAQGTDSAPAVKAVVKACLKHAREYKMVVCVLLLPAAAHVYVCICVCVSQHTPPLT